MVASSSVQKPSCHLQTPLPSSPYLHHKQNSFCHPMQAHAKSLEAKIRRAKFVFAITWKPCIHLKNNFMGNCTRPMATFLSNFSQFRCTVSKESASITISHFCIFSISAHPFQNLFHGEMHMDDSSLPKQFQPIPMHGFREIELWKLEPFSNFLEIRSSIDHEFHMGDAPWWWEHSQQVSARSALVFGRNVENKFWFGEDAATTAWTCRFERGNDCLELGSIHRTPAQRKNSHESSIKPHATRKAKHAVAGSEHATSRSFIGSRLTSGYALSRLSKMFKSTEHMRNTLKPHSCFQALPFAFSLFSMHHYGKNQLM